MPGRAVGPTECCCITLAPDQVVGDVDVPDVPGGAADDNAGRFFIRKVPLRRDVRNRVVADADVATIIAAINHYNTGNSACSLGADADTFDRVIRDGDFDDVDQPDTRV